MMKTINFNGKNYSIIRLLGKGKGGYSYLVTDGNMQFVLKQIHHEPCAYYEFGNKLDAEINDYDKLVKLGIPVPEMLGFDRANERILKEFIDGPSIFELVLKDGVRPDYFCQIHKMCKLLYAANTNIDYFPTNFIVRDGKLYYVDYERNDYMPEWNFENWGKKYWSKTPEFLEYLNKNNN